MRALVLAVVHAAVACSSDPPPKKDPLSACKGSTAAGELCCPDKSVSFRCGPDIVEWTCTTGSAAKLLPECTRVTDAGDITDVVCCPSK